MAIDTINKRRSAAPQLFYMMVMPVPDSTVNGNDRRHATGIYASILVVTSELLRSFSIKVFPRDIATKHTVKSLVRDTGRKLKILWD